MEATSLEVIFAIRFVDQFLLANLNMISTPSKKKNMYTAFLSDKGMQEPMGISKK